jgi:hypothetical protein
MLRFLRNAALVLVGLAAVIAGSMAFGASPGEAGRFGGAYLVPFAVLGMRQLWRWAWKPLRRKQDA